MKASWNKTWNNVFPRPSMFGARHLIVGPFAIMSMPLYDVAVLTTDELYIPCQRFVAERAFLIPK